MILVPPSCEELASGFVPYAGHGFNADDHRGRPRLGLLLFLALAGLVSALRLAGNAPEEAGQRRVAETVMQERKIECRNCPVATDTPNPTEGS